MWTQRFPSPRHLRPMWGGNRDSCLGLKSALTHITDITMISDGGRLWSRL
jgi:hypothetical protein